MMNIEKEYEKAISMVNNKSTSEKSFYIFQKLAAELEARSSTLAQSELKTLIKCYSQMYLLSWSQESLEEDIGYVDCMLRYLTTYMEQYPEDVMICDGCFFVLQAAYYYKELFSWVNKLYNQEGVSRKVALNWLSAPLFFWEGFLTQEEYDTYKQEYAQYVSVDTQQ